MTNCNRQLDTPTSSPETPAEAAEVLVNFTTPNHEGDRVVTSCDECRDEFEAAIIEAIAAAERRGAAQERQRCLDDIAGEALTGETGDEGDAAYNMALEHVAETIRARSLPAQKGEG